MMHRLLHKQRLAEKAVSSRCVDSVRKKAMPAAAEVAGGRRAPGKMSPSPLLLPLKQAVFSHRRSKMSFILSCEQRYLL